MCENDQAVAVCEIVRILVKISVEKESKIRLDGNKQKHKKFKT